MIKRFFKLNQRGVLFHALPVVIVALVAIVGVGYLVYARAQSTTTPQVESGIVNEGKGAWCVTSNGSPIYTAACSGATSQQWTYTASTETIKNTAVSNVSGGECLGVENNDKSAGAYIVMSTCNGSTAQKWEHTNADRSFASALSPGECLAVYGGYTGRQLRTNTCVTTYYTQMWLLNSYVTTSPPPPPPATNNLDIISTLYAYPTLSSWTQVESASSVVKYAIVNICAPDGTGSGCGSPADEPNPDWKPTLQALEAAGITPLYYISTNYGALSLATVESELANAKTWYGLTDPMFDTTATNNPSYYQALYNYAVSIGANKVVFNPGTTVPTSYMFDGTTGTKETIQVFEGTAAGFEGTSFPSWMSGYPASDFAATMSAGTATTVGTDVNDAVKDHIGNIYEDDESEPPNYSTLPSFWNSEISDVTNAN